MREVQTCFLARALLISYRNRHLHSPMAEIAERSFYTTDETLQEALRENDSATGSDPSTEDDLSSDETDSESDSDSCTDETIGEDQDEESLLEKLTNRYYKHTIQSTQERTGMQQREAELLAVRDRFCAGCGCSLDCFADFSVEEVADARLSLKRLSKAECDMLLTGKLQTFYKPPQEGSAPKRARLSYAYDSREVCEGAFCFIHGIGDYTLRALKKHLRDHGLTPHVHGNKGKKPAHAFTRVTILNVLTFIYQYAKVHGLPQPAPPKGRAGQPLQYLPASQNKKIVYNEYERACTPPEQTPVGYRSFRDIWRCCVPWIRFMTPRTDVCNRCELHRQAVKNATNEYEKQESLKRFSEHLESAQLERKLYREATDKATKELKAHKGGLTQQVAACSRNLRSSHYTFDFAQNVSIPYHARQPGPLYFKTARKVHMFGVCNEGLPKQVNYLIDESHTIGTNGTSSHGPNNVISMLHHYFAKHGLGEKGCILHADNCSGQNKNRSVIGYLAWRCMVGLHEEIQLSFMIAGHTRCLVDGCFGLIKQ